MHQHTSLLLPRLKRAPRGPYGTATSGQDRPTSGVAATLAQRLAPHLECLPKLHASKVVPPSASDSNHEATRTGCPRNLRLVRTSATRNGGLWTRAGVLPESTDQRIKIAERESFWKPDGLNRHRTSTDTIGRSRQVLSVAVELADRLGRQIETDGSDDLPCRTDSQRHGRDTAPTGRSIRWTDRERDTAKSSPQSARAVL